MLVETKQARALLIISSRSPPRARITIRLRITSQARLTSRPQPFSTDLGFLDSTAGFRECTGCTEHSCLLPVLVHTAIQSCRAYCVLHKNNCRWLTINSNNITRLNLLGGGGGRCGRGGHGTLGQLDVGDVHLVEMRWRCGGDAVEMHGVALVQRVRHTHTHA